MLDFDDKLTWYRKLKILRAYSGKSQLDLAKSMCVSVRSYNRWELGTHVPLLIFRNKIAEVLGVNASDLFGDNPTTKENTDA